MLKNMGDFMSNLSLERLLFNAAAPTDGPLIGSYLIGAGGSVLTETNVGADYGLDVNLINASIVVTATNLDIRDLSANQDSVKIGDGTDFLEINNDGSINVVGSVTATIASEADDAVSTLNPVFVGGISANQANALGSVSASGDRTSLTTDLYRRVFINDAPNISVDHSVLTCGLTEVAIPTLAGQTRIMLQNISDKPIFVGKTGVTISGATRGLEIAKGATLALECGQAIALYAISSAAAKELVVFKLA